MRSVFFFFFFFLPTLLCWRRPDSNNFISFRISIQCIHIWTQQFYLIDLGHCSSIEIIIVATTRRKCAQKSWRCAWWSENATRKYSQMGSKIRKSNVYAVRAVRCHSILSLNFEMENHHLRHNATRTSIQYPVDFDFRWKCPDWKREFIQLSRLGAGNRIHKNQSRHMLLSKRAFWFDLNAIRQFDRRLETIVHCAQQQQQTGIVRCSAAAAANAP